MEDVLGPIMFEVPSTETIAKVIVTLDAVVNNAPPTMISRKAAAKNDTLPQAESA
jgi:ATP-dependent Clp protease ATP-binding subunit ClpX